MTFFYQNLHLSRHTTMDKRLLHYLLKRPSTWFACAQVAIARARNRHTVTVWRQGLRVHTGTGNGEGLFCALAGTEYEAEMEWFLDRMKPGQTFVDVGANIGIYSLHASKRLGCNGAVHAFEPTMETFSILEGNIARNRLTNIRANRLALAEKSGTLVLVAEGRPASNSTSADVDQSPDAVRIEATTLDEYTGSNPGMKVDLIKVDIEGGERAFFEGARKTFLSDKPLILFESEHTGPDFPERAVLRDIGYKLHLLENGELVEVPHGSQVRSNLIAIFSRPHSQ